MAKLRKHMAVKCIYTFLLALYVVSCVVSGGVRHSFAGF